MMCDQRGYPLRWHTLSGKYHDATALLEMAKEAAALSWVKGPPIVMDRAAGNAGATETLDGTGLRYITALPDPELASSGAPIPWEVLDQLQAETTVEGVALRLEAAGFTKADGTRYIRDLGVFEKSPSASASPITVATRALQVLALVEAGVAIDGIAAKMEISTRQVYIHKRLTTLTMEIRARLGSAGGEFLGMRDLQRLAEAEPEEQAKLLDEVLAAPDKHRHSVRGEARPGYRARAILSIGPDRFLDNRSADEESHAKVELEVADLNRRLTHKANRRTDGSALSEIESALRTFKLRARVKITGAFGRRRIPMGCVGTPLHIGDMRGRPSLPLGRVDALGAPTYFRAGP